MTGPEIVESAGEWLPISEAARRVGVTERTVERRMQTGRWPKRQRSDGRVEVFVPADAVRQSSDGLSGLPDLSRTLAHAEELGAAIARGLSDRDRLLIDLARENERLRLELDAARAALELARPVAVPTCWARLRAWLWDPADG